MTPRMPNPTLVVPGALQALLDLRTAIENTGIPKDTLVLLHLRISQLNGRAIDIPTDETRAEAAEDRRHRQVHLWREADVFTAAERAALALAETATRMGPGSQPVTDEIWAEAARHYNEQQLGALVLQVGAVNLWNRVNIVTRQDGLDWSVPDEEWVPMTTRLTSA